MFLMDTICGKKKPEAINMKISKKLKENIHKIIQDECIKHSLVIDEEYRSGRISHESWKAIYQSYSNMKVIVPHLVFSAIEIY